MFRLRRCGVETSHNTPGGFYNPYSVHIISGVPMRDPFPGNIVPQSMQDPVGRNILTYYPAPNVVSPQPGVAVGAGLGFLFRVAS